MRKSIEQGREAVGFELAMAWKLSFNAEIDALYGNDFCQGRAMAWKLSFNAEINLVGGGLVLFVQAMAWKLSFNAEIFFIGAHPTSLLQRWLGN